MPEFTRAKFPGLIYIPPDSGGLHPYELDGTFQPKLFTENLSGAEGQVC